MRAASLDGRERDPGQPLSRMDARGSIDYGSEERRSVSAAGPGPVVTGGPAPRTQSPRPGSAPDRGGPRRLPSPAGRPEVGERIDGRDSTRERGLDPKEIYRDWTDWVDYCIF